MVLKTKGKRVNLLVVICATLLMMCLTMLWGSTKEAVAKNQITLQFATFEPPSGFAANAHKTWADELEKSTQGKVKVEMVWGSAMGKMAEHYDLVQTGIADIAYFLPKMTPGLFPLSDITELPWVLTEYDITIKALWKLYNEGYLDKEYADVKVLFLFTGAQTTQFSRIPIKSLADMKGKKIGGGQQDQIKAMGAVPVTIFLPEMYSALDKGIIDAEWTPFVSIPPFRIHEVTKYAITPVFGNPVCVVAMNKAVYNKLPDDIKKITDELAEDVMLPLTIKGYQEVGGEGERLFTEAGGTIYKWSAADIAEMKKRFRPVWENWIAEREAKGAAASQTIKGLWSILKDSGVQDPAIGYEPGN